MKSKKIPVILLFFCAILVCLCSALQLQQQKLASHLIRLHVVANSDGEEDQRLKLLVRDAVLAETAKLSDADADPKKALAEHLDAICQAAQQALLSEGCTDPVTVRLGKEPFPTRQYDTFRLPAGVYESLRVSIGNADGHNWWCVVFPSLCMAASSEDLVEAAQAAGLSDGQIRLITETNEGYTVKFKILELLQQLKNFLWDA